MSSELSVIARFIVGSLNGDAAAQTLCGGRVHAGFAKSGTAYPCVVFSDMHPEDLTPPGTKKVTSQALMLIEAIGKGNGYEAIDPLVERINDLFRNNPPRTVGDGSLISCYRVGPFEAMEQDIGVTYYRRGGIYRFFVRTGQ